MEKASGFGIAGRISSLKRLGHAPDTNARKISTLRVHARSKNCAQGRVRFPFYLGNRIYLWSMCLVPKVKAEKLKTNIHHRPWKMNQKTGSWDGENGNFHNFQFLIF
jgi:hypothetical protein